MLMFIVVLFIIDETWDQRRAYIDEEIEWLSKDNVVNMHNNIFSREKNQILSFAEKRLVLDDIMLSNTS